PVLLGPDAESDRERRVDVRRDAVLYDGVPHPLDDAAAPRAEQRLGGVAPPHLVRRHLDRLPRRPAGPDVPDVPGLAGGLLPVLDDEGPRVAPVGVTRWSIRP